MYKRIEGMTLIEVLIALAILMVGVLGIVGMQVALIKGNMDSRNHTSAVILAEKKIEDLKFVGFNIITNGTEACINETGQSGGIFSRSWTVTPNHLSSANLKQVTVTVTWVERGRPHSVSLDTVLSSKFD